MSRYGITIVMISGRKYAGEIVSLASAFLGVTYLSIIPVSTSLDSQEDFLLPLDIYLMRDFSIRYQRSYNKWGYNDGLLLPRDDLADMGLFWLALDPEGYAIAKDILSRNNLSPDEKLYDSVFRANLITPEVPPYPETVVSSRFWGEIKSALRQTEQQHPGVSSKEGRKKLFAKYVPPTPTEKIFFSWYASLRDSLKPWDAIIQNIISAQS